MKSLRKNKVASLAKQKGISLMDQMLWLLGAILVVAFIIFMKNSGFPMLQGWRASSMSATAIQKLNSVYSGQNNFTGLTTASAAVRSIYDDKYLNGAVISNVFGGTTTYGVTTIGAAANNTMQQTESNVPRRSCETYVQNIASEVDRISVGGTIVKDVGAVVVTATLLTQCNSADNLVILNEKIKQS